MSDRVLLIGGAGLVGRHVRTALEGRDVVTTYHRDPIEGGVPLDITDASAVERIVAGSKPAAIVLAAADPYVEGCERDPLGTRRINVEAASVIRDAAPDATLVVFSSEYVFDGTRLAYREDDTVGPLAKRPAKAGLADAKLQQVLGHGLRRAEDALADLARA